MIESHDNHGKIMHRPYSRCISSVEEIDEGSIEFSLLTQTWSGFKLSQLKSYTDCFTIIRKRNCHDSILFVILWEVEAKYI